MLMCAGPLATHLEPRLVLLQLGNGWGEVCAGDGRQGGDVVWEGSIDGECHDGFAKLCGLHIGWRRSSVVLSSQRRGLSLR